MNFKKALVSTLGTAAVLGAGFFASTTSANADVRVTVKSGDTVAKIANQYNSSISAIESANSLKNVNMIYVGESLVIPSSASTTTTTQTTTPSTSQTTSANTNAATTTQAATTGTTNYSSQQNTSANTTANTTSTSSASTGTSTSTSSSSEAAAKAWIANKESGGSYSATNGQYIGKYQLSASYLNGDYSAANQEKVANQYVSSRYGSWAKAQAFWQANGWY
ncbi:LysM domain-containing protein [Levilactobacillus zymae]|uniref:aggregation-promoting factor n=1 Tax=Levilactobacillus zymae TaxID=267363 RepID=UPI0028B3AA94|nr:LysM domain-containing protein [Levilactobacillus zymae]MDT6981590.1 LysM domain-containing protein [Levilactobacillus zymae]